MKNIILLVIFTLTIYADSIEVPKWLLEDPSNNGKYFRGASNWYDTNSSDIKLITEKDALENAYNHIYKHFDINKKTDQFTLKLKPIKNYIETSDDKKNSRQHLLLLLDEKSEKEINNILKDRKEFNKLKEQILNSIEEKRYFKARSYLELAKKTKSALIDDTIEKIETRLNRLIRELLQAKISTNKRVYLPDESIELEVSLNKNGYLYLFYETGVDVEMIFPNEHQKDSYLNKNQLISFPNDGVEEITAYGEDLGKKVGFYAIASKKHLNLKSLSLERDEGIYIYEKTGNYIKLIEGCIDDGECTKTTINFEISHAAKSAPVVLEFNSDDLNKKDIIKYFKSKGVVSKKSSKKIEFYVKKITRYNNNQEHAFKTFHITSYLYNNGTLVKSLENECSKEELNEYLLEMYDELQKV